jgi:hypothetical protein
MRRSAFCTCGEATCALKLALSRHSMYSNKSRILDTLGPMVDLAPFFAEALPRDFVDHLFHGVDRIGTNMKVSNNRISRCHQLLLIAIVRRPSPQGER